MIQRLKTLALDALVGTFSDKYHDEHTEPELIYSNGKVIPEAVKRFCLDVDTLGLPKTLESEAKLVASEVLRKKYGRKVLRWITANDLGRAKNPDSLRFLYDPAASKVESPVMRRYFPEERQRHLAVDFFFALTLRSPREDPFEIQKLWISPEFLPLQTTFLDHFQEIWTSVLLSIARMMPSHSVDYLVYFSPMAPLLSMPFWSRNTDLFHLSNDRVPRFVFDVLNADQREKFLELGQTALFQHDDKFVLFFTNIFCHWPWQKKALEHFRAKDRLSPQDWIILHVVRRLKSYTEQVSDGAEVGIVPEEASFRLQVIRLLEKRRVELSEERSLEILDIMPPGIWTV